MHSNRFHLPAVSCRFVNVVLNSLDSIALTGALATAARFLLFHASASSFVPVAVCVLIAVFSVLRIKARKLFSPA